MNATATKTRTAKKPVTRTAQWMCFDPHAEFTAGRGACLRLDIGDEIDVYEVFPIVTAGRITGWTMTKMQPDGEVAQYTLPLDCSRCNCPHSVHRPNAQPCRHRAALRASLNRIGYAIP